MGDRVKDPGLETPPALRAREATCHPSLTPGFIFRRNCPVAFVLKPPPRTPSHTVRRVGRTPRASTTPVPCRTCSVRPSFVSTPNTTAPSVQHDPLEKSRGSKKGRSSLFSCEVT